MQTVLIEEPNGLVKKSLYESLSPGHEATEPSTRVLPAEQTDSRLEQSFVILIALDLQRLVKVSSGEGRAGQLQRSATLITLCRTLPSWRE